MSEKTTGRRRVENRVVDYQVEWKAEEGMGTIEVKIKSHPSLCEVPLDNPQQFTAVPTLLQDEGTLYWDISESRLSNTC